MKVSSPHFHAMELRSFTDFHMNGIFPPIRSSPTHELNAAVVPGKATPSHAIPSQSPEFTI